jgi:Zn-dependent M16 (insulinase) family peptidase
LRKHGFTLLFETRVEELDSTARLWRHDQSAAQLLSFCNKDENKVFGVTLRTPPPDSSGLPHILEHSVLCGSAKYPVKEPFVELLKGSLQTFLNAFTYPDKTCYPVASANLQDFYNLVDVYLDAVFHPNIGEAVFQQEGWHLDAAEEPGRALSPISPEEAEISFKGVVYNEMKGVFSSPEAVLERAAMHSLFPDTPYGLESGGDPAHIPALTYAEFTDFHRRFYHPSNARFYFWGDDPEEKRLEILGNLLQDYRRADVSASRVPLQAAFSARKSFSFPFAAGEDGEAIFTLNWALPASPGAPGSAEEIEKILALEMLEHILLAMPASPLRRALIESGLGEDLAGVGLESELRQMLFSVGLKGLKSPEDARLVEELILRNLHALAENGIPVSCVEAAVNTVEFALRENNTGRFPVGLAVMLRSLATWLYCDEPSEESVLAPLRFEAPLAAVKRKALREHGASPGYFEDLLKKYLLDNQHCCAILLYPDKEMDEKQAQEERGRLEKVLAGVMAQRGPEGRAHIAADSRKLRLWQERPDKPEDLAKIPRLRVEDLPLQAAEIEQRLPENLSAPVYFHPQPTRGICYLDVCLNLGAVPDRLLPLAPLLGRAMLEMGNAGRDFIELNMEIARTTGGLDSDLTLLTKLDSRECLACLCLSGKAAPDKIGAMFELVAELLSETSLNNREQFLRMLLEEKARLEHGLVPAGHMLVSSRLKAGTSLSGVLAERTAGVSYLEFIRKLAEEAVADWPGVAAGLEELRKIVLNRKGLLFNITAEAGQEELVAGLAEVLAGRLPVLDLDPVIRNWPELPSKEALLLPAQVNFVGKGLNIFDLGYNFHGSALVILKYLRTGYLWEKIRVQGGAYGAFASLDRFSGDFIFASYRDPNIGGTLQAFDASMRYLATHKPAKSELAASIIGAVGELDSYLLPEAKGKAAFVRSLTGNTPQLRAKTRAEVLGAEPAHFKAFGEFMLEALPRAREVALGGKSLEEYAAKNSGQGWVSGKIL